MAMETRAEDASRKEYIPRPVDRVAQAEREKAHVDWRVRSGTLAHGVFEGSGIVKAYRDGRDVEIVVVAGDPEPLKNFVPHGDFEEGQPVEMVTPLSRPT